MLYKTSLLLLCSITIHYAFSMKDQNKISTESIIPQVAAELSSQQKLWLQCSGIGLFALILNLTTDYLAYEKLDGFSATIQSGFIALPIIGALFGANEIRWLRQQINNIIQQNNNSV